MAKTTEKMAEFGNALLNNKGMDSPLIPGVGQFSPEASEERMLNRDSEARSVRQILQDAKKEAGLPGLVIPVADLRAIFGMDAAIQ